MAATFAAQGLQGLHGLAATFAAQGLQGLHGLAATFAAQGLQGLVFATATASDVLYVEPPGTAQAVVVSRIVAIAAWSGFSLHRLLIFIRFVYLR